MKILASAMVVAIGLTWPGAGEAQQSKKTKARSAAVTQQQYAPRRAKTAVNRNVAQRPCVARNWTGCLGWDPDPNVRSMIRMDAGHDDY